MAAVAVSARPLPGGPRISPWFDLKPPFYRLVPAPDRDPTAPSKFRTAGPCCRASPGPAISRPAGETASDQHHADARGAIGALALYALAGVWLNPWFAWVASPLIVAWVVLWRTGAAGSRRAVVAATGFALACATLLLFVHFAWFLDLGRTNTGSSTSALIFVVLPVYAFFAGILGAAAGWWWAGRAQRFGA